MHVCLIFPWIRIQKCSHSGGTITVLAHQKAERARSSFCRLYFTHRRVALHYSQLDSKKNWRIGCDSLESHTPFLAHALSLARISNFSRILQLIHQQNVAAPLKRQNTFIQLVSLTLELLIFERISSFYTFPIRNSIFSTKLSRILWKFDKKSISLHRRNLSDGDDIANQKAFHFYCEFEWMAPNKLDSHFNSNKNIFSLQ